MTKIADIYDGIITKVGTAATGYVRVPDPYTLTANSALLINKGYGLSIGPGTNTERYVGCLATWERQFTIGLIAQVFTTENDTINRASAEKAMLDVHRAILLAFESDPTIGATCMKSVITDDTGIQYEEGERSKFLVLEITLSVEYQEPNS